MATTKPPLIESTRKMKSTILGLTIAVLTAVGSAQAQDKSPGNADAGALIFKRCMACHAVGPDAKNGVGPVLNGVVGRAAPHVCADLGVYQRVLEAVG